MAATAIIVLFEVAAMSEHFTDIDIIVKLLALMVFEILRIRHFVMKGNGWKSVVN